MEKFTTPKPKKRGKLRLFLGRNYYCALRRIAWLMGYICGVRFSKQHKETILPHMNFQHETPLLRQLRNVDMVLQYNKIINLKIAVKKLDKVIIYPGETFSYWKLIGKPTKRKGYLHGMVLQGGTFKPGTGGGICQLSNLIYWITLHTPLTITERHRHGYDVFPDSNRTQPFGSGATCSYNYLDLCIRNDTAQPFQLHLQVAEKDLIGFWASDVPPTASYHVYESEHRMDSEFWGGYSRHNVLRRKVYDLAGNELDDELITKNHALMMYSPFIETAKNIDL